MLNLKKIKRENPIANVYTMNVEFEIDSNRFYWNYMCSMLEGWSSRRLHSNYEDVALVVEICMSIDQCFITLGLRNTGRKFQYFLEGQEMHFKMIFLLSSP